MEGDFPLSSTFRPKMAIKINFQHQATLGYMLHALTIEGPFKKDASSFFISFRRSYFDEYLKPLIPNLIKLHFYDFTTKTNIKMSRRDRLYLTFYKGEDKFRMKSGDADTSGLNWGNTSLTMRWNHIFGTRLFTNTTLATSKYDYYLYGSVNKINTGCQRFPIRP